MTENDERMLLYFDKALEEVSEAIVLGVLWKVLKEWNRLLMD